MKKKLILTGMILLALVLTGGIFAYSYSSFSTVTLNSALAAESIVTYAPSATPPNWNSLLPEGEYASETLLPDAPGDETGLSQHPSAGQNWEKVTTDDGLTTYVYNDSKWYHTDLYNLADLNDDVAISGVTVYFRFAGSAGTIGYAEAVIKTDGTIFEGNEESQNGPAFVTRSYQWTNNPATDEPWTTDDINALQAGVSLKKQQGSDIAVCTQVYVAVSYESFVTQGEVPAGNLYDITPNPSYYGDLLVKVYLTDTANLTKAYQYLNMKLKVENSLEAENTPDYLILSIDNGVAIFNIKGGAASSYTVKVIGGSYRVIGADTEQWGAGWSITPEFYCEVSQR